MGESGDSLSSENRPLASFDASISMGMSVNIGVTLSVEIVDEQDRVDQEIGEQAEQVLEQSLAVTKFPSWVRMSYVNRIRNLNCFETVREMILSGTPIIEVAKQIHSLGEAKSLTLESLRLYLDHFKATLPAWIMAMRQQPKQFLEIKRKADSTVDVLQELNRLYLWTKERLEIGMSQERRFQLLTNGMDKNFAIASRLLDQISEVKERLGVTEDQTNAAMPKKLTDQVDWNRIYARESVQKVMSNPEQRSRVVQVAERLFDMYSSKLSPEQMDKKEKAIKDE